ncbi:MAG: hypothetical protein O3B87_01845 [bacterium]|nr:hypothetical protein [bacterium]
MKKRLNLEEEFGSRLSSKGLFNYAQTFYNSFSELVHIDSDTTRFHPVQYYLASHSIELALKSVLRDMGFTYDQLMNLGHDLEEILRKVQEIDGMEFAVQEVAVIKALNVYYYAKQLEYFIQGYKEFPDLLITDVVVMSLLDKAKEVILNGK